MHYSNYRVNPHLSTQYVQGLEDIKVNAQNDEKPVLRNIAKLLMNSRYGRFGMHTPEIKFAIVNSQELVRIAEIYSILENVNLGALNLVTYALDRSVLNFGDQKNINR